MTPLPPAPFHVHVKWQEQMFCHIPGEFPFYRDNSGNVYITEEILNHPFCKDKSIEEILEAAVAQNIERTKDWNPETIVITSYKIINP